LRNFGIADQKRKRLGSSTYDPYLLYRKLHIVLSDGFDLVLRNNDLTFDIND
jgi:hypothetical protein